MIEVLIETTFYSMIIMLQVLLWVIIGGFLINLWEVMMNWWNEVFFNWGKNK